MNRQRDRQFRRQWLLAIAILLALGMATAYDLYVDRNKVRSTEYDRLLVQARVIDENLSHQLTATDTALQRILGDLPYWRADGSYRPVANLMLSTIEGAMPGIRTLLIIDVKGIVRASNRRDLMGRDLSQREYFRSVRKSHDPATLYLSPPYTTVLNAFAMNLSRMVPGRKGEFDGIVVATLDPDYFKTLLASVQYAPDMWVAVAHGDGIQFVMVPDRPGQSGKNLAKPGSFFTRHRASGRTESIMTGRVYATGEDRVMALRTILPRDAHLDIPLVVAVGRDIHDVFAEWRMHAMLYGVVYLVTVAVTVLSLRLYQKSVRRADEEVKHAEQALEKSEKSYRLLAENTTDVVWQFDLRANRYIYVSPSVYHLRGYTSEEVMAQTMEESLTPESLKLVQNWIANAIREFAAGRTAPKQELREIEQTRKDGTAVWTEVSATYILDEDKKPVGIVGISRDITERRTAADLLRKQAALLHLAPAAVMVRDLNSRIIYWNRGAEELYGWTNGEAAGNVSHELLKTEFPIPLAEIQDRIFRESKWEGELLHRKRTGETITVASRWALQKDAEGKPAALLEINIDITERKRLGAAVREREEKYKFLIEATSTGYVIIDREGRVIEANQEYVRMTGRSSIEEIIGKPVTEWTADYDLSRNAEEVKRCMQQGFVRNLIIDYIDRQGRITPVEINATVLRDPQAVRIFTICRDITERRRIEQALVNSEKKYRLLIESLQEGIWLIDADDNTSFVNQSMAQMLGYSIEEMLGRHLFSFMDERGKTIAMRQLESRKQGVTEQHDFEFLHKDGARVYTTLTASPVLDEAGKYAGSLAGVMNITDRRRAEEAVRESAERFRALAEQSITGICIIRNGTFAYVNPRIAEILEYRPEEMIGLSPVELALESDRETVRENFRKRLAGETTGVHYYFTTRTKTGVLKEMEVHGNAIMLKDGPAIMATLLDVTERKLAEEALKQSEKKLRDITSSLAEGLYVLDDRGEITFMNPEAELLLGWTEAELRGKNAHDVVHNHRLDGTAVSFAECPIHSVTMKGERYISRDEVFIRKDGTIFPVSVHSSPLVESGRIVASVTAFRDITERKQIEKEREQLIAELQKALAEIKTLHGILPICSSCKKIRDDKGAWHQMEAYIHDHTSAEFSHGLCNECAKKLYADYYTEDETDGDR